MTTEIKPENELIPVKKLENPLQIFQTNEMDKLIEGIREQCADFKPDLSTDKSRKEIASMAYKVSRSKTALTELSNKLTEDWKAKTKAVVDVRKNMEQKLDELRDEVRKPLSDWEDEEKTRIEGFKNRLSEIEEIGTKASINWQESTSSDLEHFLSQVKEIEINESWGDYQDKAKEVKSIAIDKIDIAIQKLDLHLKEQAELEKLREEAAERQREKDEADRIQAEKAEKEADEKEQKAEEERIEKERADAAEKARKEEREKADQEAAEAEEERLKKAKDKEAEDQRKIDEAQKATNEALEREQAANKRADEAAEAERIRATNEENEKLAAAKRREDDLDHKRKINIAAIQAIMKVGIDEPKAKDVVRAIYMDEVPNIKITY